MFFKPANFFFPTENTKGIANAKDTKLAKQNIKSVNQNTKYVNQNNEYNKKTKYAKQDTKYANQTKCECVFQNINLRCFVTM